MKPVIKNKTAIFQPQGFLDANNAPFIVETQEVELFKKRKDIEGVFVSLKKVIFFNKNGIDEILKRLLEITKERKELIIGFTDYDKRKFETLLKIFKDNINCNLFENQKTASLFIGEAREENKNRKIIVYNENTEQKNIIAVELIERGYSTLIAKNREDFEKRKDNFDIAIHRSYLGLYNQKVVAKIKDNAIIYILRNFIDSEFQNIFDINYHFNLLRVGFKLFIFDISHISSMNIHGANFFAKLVTAGAEYNATFVIAGADEKKITKSLKENLELVGMLFYESIEKVFEDKNLIESTSKSNLSVKRNSAKITKEIVKYLPTFIESTINTIEVMSGIKAVKKSVNLKPLNIEGEDYFAATIGFYGYFEAIIILIFSKELIKKSCSILLEEEDEIDDLTLLDTLGEFVNIIAGKVKASLAKENINVNITLPRTYQNIKALLESQKNRKGIQIDFQFDKDPFYFYISNSY